MEEALISDNVNVLLRLQPERDRYWNTLMPGLWLGTGDSEDDITLTLAEALALLEWLKAREAEIREALA